MKRTHKSQRCRELVIANQPATAQSYSSLSYAPKPATATRHKMPIIVPLVTILLRLLHGLVIVLLFVARDDGLGRDRGRLFAARVHPLRRWITRKELGTTALRLLQLTRPFTDISTLSHSSRSRLSKKNAPQTNYYYFTRCEMRAVNILLPTTRLLEFPRDAPPWHS